MAVEPDLHLPIAGPPVRPHRTPGAVVGGLLRGMRPRQWVKNVLVFAAPAAAGTLQHWPVAWRALGAFALFCALASGLYLWNDTVDAEADRHHPVKRHRPVASGLVPARLAVVTGGVLVVGSIAVGGVVYGHAMALVLGAYAAITVAYTLRLKREPILELACVASGFVLRPVAGGVATGVPLSSWFLVVISFGALFVVTGKRASEHAALGDDRSAHRATLGLYTMSFLQSTLILSAAVTVTAYCLWAFERAGLLLHTRHHPIWVQLTVVPVILALLHVFRLLDAGRGGSPEELVFKDRFLQVMGLAWIALFAVGLYA